MNRAFRKILFLLPVILLSSPAYARTWYVLPDSTGDAPTVQAAIDSSGDGDTVLVAAGTYFVNLKIQSKNDFSLIGEAGPQSTILDGRFPVGGTQFKYQVIHCLSSNEVLIEGFTIREGRPDAPQATLGGGILVGRGNCTIRGNIIRDNENVNGAAIGFGAGTTGTAGTIVEGNEIRNNNSVGGSAGIYIYQCEGPIWVTNNLFSGNVGTYAALESENTQLYVQSNLCHTNEAVLYCFGIEYGDFIIEDNLLRDNEAGGIWSREGIIRNNTCANNEGWGLINTYGTLHNNISVGNREDGIVSYNTDSVTCNDSWNNGGIDFIFEGTVSDTSGNISEDPLFCNPASGVYSITPESPCAPENSGGCGLIGALDVGCVATSVPAARREETSWGAIKTLFR